MRRSRQRSLMTNRSSSVTSHQPVGLLYESMSQSHLTLTKSLSPGRFRTHLEGLQDEFEIMALEIESLKQERDQYKAEVEANAKELEHVRRQIACDRCQGKNVGTPQLIAPSQQGVIPSNQTDGSAQPSILSLAAEPTRLLPESHTTSLVADTTIANFVPSPSSQVPTVAVDPNANSKTHGWSITFNDQVRKELDVELAHTSFHEMTILSIKFSHNGQFLAAACEDGKAYIYDVQTGMLTCVLRNLLAKKEVTICAVCFSHDGKYLATASSDNYIYIWEIKTKYVRNGFKGHTKSVSTLCFSPNGRLLLSASEDHTTRLWDMRYGSAKILTAEKSSNYVGIPSAVFSPNGRYIAASSNVDQVLRIWDAYAGRLIRKLMVHGAPAYDIALMPDGSGLLSGGFGQTIMYWDISALADTRFPANNLTEHDSEVEGQTRPDREYSGHTGCVYSLAITTDGRWVASGSEDRSVRIWDTRSAAMQCTINDSEEIYCIDFSPTGSFLAAGRDDGTLRIWRYSSSRGVSDTR